MLVCVHARVCACVYVHMCLCVCIVCVHVCVHVCVCVSSAEGERSFPTSSMWDKGLGLIRSARSCDPVCKSVRDFRCQVSPPVVLSVFLNECLCLASVM